MPSQKRKSSSDNNLLHHHDSSLQQPSRCKQSRRQRGAENGDDNEDERDYEQDEEEEEQQQQQQVKEEEQDSEDEDSDGSRSSDDPAKLPEWLVELPALRTYVECPICLGIIKKTRTVTECLHRFCGECIDKWMRMGNKECPACRTHCASQRSLRDDPKFDTLIHFLYDDIEKYEEEELAFHEEEMTRDKQELAFHEEETTRDKQELAFHEEETTRDKQASTSMKHGHLSGGHIPVSDTLERLGHVGTKAV